MDRTGTLRFLLLVGAGLFLFLSLQSWMGGGDVETHKYAGESKVVPDERAPDAHCDIFTERFHARIRTRGAALTHFELLTAKYRREGEPFDVSTTPDPEGEHEFRQQLFTRWRSEVVKPDDPWNLAYDSVDFRIDRADSKTCVLSYRDDAVTLTKTISTTGQPYELSVESTIENLASESRKHAFNIDTVAYRTTNEVAGEMFRISPYITHAECVPNEGETVRLLPDDFAPEEFANPPFARTVINPTGDWHRAPGAPAVAAVSNAYFTHALVPIASPVEPACLLQIEERFDPTKGKSDPNAGAMYRARLAYPPVDLDPGESKTYSTLTFIGPKERIILGAAGGGEHRLIELIDLGFFAAIAKVLVAFLLKVYSVIPNWGVAIIILTLTARILLFPLSLPSIKNMIRMRELKPEMDALNEKYKDDPQQKGLAQMELWRKHKVNPFKGCLPQLASMPVWFALYTTLQTAVELYNIPFLWFPDLSERDPVYILPFVIGGTFFLQQKIMPMQGGDPMQQKMMMYFMPGMFTVFMLFLPSGLGVYMFTNSLLAIAQQWGVEWHTRRTVKPGSADKGEIEVKVKDDPEPTKGGGGRGKSKKRRKKGSKAA